MIQFKCPNCSVPFKVKDELAGRSSKCPRCEFRVVVPEESEADFELEIYQPTVPVAVTRMPKTPLAGLVALAGLASILLPLVFKLPTAGLAVAFGSVALGFIGWLYSMFHAGYGRIGFVVGMLFGVAGIVASGLVGASKEPMGLVQEVANHAKGLPAAANRAVLDVSKGQYFVESDLKVTVTGARIGRVKANSFGQSAYSDKEYLVIDLSISNLNPNRKAEYSGWSDGVLQKGTLDDDLGNHYRMIGFGFSADIEGQVHSTQSIYQAQPLKDVLVFEVPVKNARKLVLSLPKSVLNLGEGNMDFLIECPK